MCQQLLVDCPPFLAIPNLPTFVGRQRLLRTIKSQLAAEKKGRMIVLVGMAGVGKTALATHLAYQLRDQWPDGVLWARPDISPTMTILHLFAEVYGRSATAYEDLESRSAYVRHLLAEKQALIVLDNLESQQQLLPLLPPSSNASVLITTRRRDLSPPTATQLDVEPFTADESVALFAQVLGETRVANEQAQLAQIADIVGHLPLAVDILACRLMVEPELTTAVCIAELQASHNLLDHLNHQDRCVRAALNTTLAHMPLEQRHFFAKLGAMRKIDFTVGTAAAAAKVTQSTAQAYLATLFCLSLVRRGRGGRYRLTPLMQTLAEEFGSQSIKISG